MLAAADLDGAIECQRGPRGVGAGGALTPIGARHKVHRLGPPAGVVIALDPQQCSVGCRDSHRDPGVDGIVDEKSANQGQSWLHRMCTAELCDVVRARIRLRRNLIGGYSGGETASSTVSDHRPQCGVRQVSAIDIRSIVNGAERCCGAVATSRTSS
jgi:hypothetical protein